MRLRLSAVLVLAACSALVQGHAAEPLRIAAAADLQPLLPPLLVEFQRATGIEAEASFGASAALATQIENGAPFDVFLAADTSFPQRVIAEHLAVEPAPLVYARGTLVLYARNDAPLLRSAPGGRLTLELLRSPALRSLALANPDRAPYGRAAKAALGSMGLLPALGPRLVTADNIAQAAQFVFSGNAELGFVSLTSALTPALRSAGQYVVVPRESYPALLQGAIILSRSTEQEQARRFLEFLQSPAVRLELGQHGLAAPE